MLNFNHLIRPVQSSDLQVPPPAPVRLNDRFQAYPDLQRVATGKASLSRGHEGESVKALQTALTDLGFYAGDSADGVYGAQTAQAVKNFQNNQNLPASGQVDQKTLMALNRIVPAPGVQLWQTPAKDQLSPSNDLGKLGKARVVIDLSEHRLFLYDDKNKVKKIYSVATGNPQHPDGRGQKTSTGVRVVNTKVLDPAPVAWALWPETRGRAFGTRLLDLSALDPKTGAISRIGEELHGTYARSSIGTDASHGCMRMQNEDIEEVYQQLKKGDLIKVQD
jgi:L,D-transpeptidase ErfK/SrfK